jgi:hypothetical protein
MSESILLTSFWPTMCFSVAMSAPGGFPSGAPPCHRRKEPNSITAEKNRIALVLETEPVEEALGDGHGGAPGTVSTWRAQIREGTGRRRGIRPQPSIWRRAPERVN